MKRTFDVAVLAVFLLAVPVGAMAQQPAPTVTATPRTPALQQSTTAPGTEPLVSVFGVPVIVSAPVARPYCACAYSNFGGQPMRTAAAVAAEVGGEAP